MKNIRITLVMVCFLVAGKSYAQDFVYTPKNPAFGGNPYNYSWLLSSAQAQNETNQSKSTSSSYSTESSNPLKNFTESLNQQILSQLSRQIVSKQFGESGLSSGTYVLGDYQIEVGNQSTGLNIKIVDKKTGSQTSVLVPYF